MSQLNLSPSSLISQLNLTQSCLVAVISLWAPHRVGEGKCGSKSL
jgi:hypothetical protein